MAEAEILNLQVPPDSPEPLGMTAATDLLLPARRTIDRLAHMPESVYDLAPEGHLMRFAKVILGDAGAGQLRKRLLVSRLQQTLWGSHFFDLDRFYGALFGVRRRRQEMLKLDPYVDIATAETWSEEHAKDASYRSRIEQFARAIHKGPTPIGMEMVAESLLSADCEVYESFHVADSSYQTYAELEAQGTYASFEGKSYRDLEGYQLGRTTTTNRREFTVRPKRPITLEERYDLTRVLSRLKPVDALATIDHEGIRMHDRIPLRSMFSDSEYWEVAQREASAAPGQSNRSRTQRMRPPFSAYQGEVWSCNSDISGVVCYTSATKAKHLPVQRLVTTEGDIIEFLPEDALSSRKAPLNGRYASDAILIAHPYSQARVGMPTFWDDTGHPWLPGPPAYVGTSPLFIDRQPLEVLQRQMAKGDGRVESEISKRFWCTPPRYHHDSTEEVFEVRMKRPRMMNYLSFERSHYPHGIRLEFFNDETGRWEEEDSVDTRLSILDSIPTAIQPDFHNVKSHPHHPEGGHWNRVAYKFSAREVTRFRIVLWRIEEGEAPEDIRMPRSVSRPFGQPGPEGWVAAYSWTTGTPDSPQRHTVWRPGKRARLSYSLALRKLETGYRCNDRSDLPTVIYEPEANPVGSTEDPFGNRIEFVINESKASNLLTDGGKPWLSQPQPVNDAVVNLYVDTRGEDGRGEVVDRFYIDPTHPGPSLNLYWSNDTPDAEFDANDQIIPYGMTDAQGSLIPSSDGLIFPSGESPSIRVNNAAVQFDPRVPWWAGFEVRTAFSSETTAARQILDLGVVTVDFHSGFLRVTRADNGDVLSLPVAFPGPSAREDFRSNVVVIVSWDGEGLSLRYAHGDQDRTAVLAGAPFTSRPKYLRVGAPGMVLRSLVLKRAKLDPSQATKFLADPRRYVLKPHRKAGRNQLDAETTHNAILRYSPVFTTTERPWALVGGEGDIFEDVVWNPIARDYSLTKGYIHVPVTRAKFWKFEFTNLVPEPYEVFVPVKRKVRLFPPEVINATDWGQHNRNRSSSGESGPPGTRASINLAQVAQFIDDFVSGVRGQRGGDIGNLRPETRNATQSFADAVSQIVTTDPLASASATPYSHTRSPTEALYLDALQSMPGAHGTINALLRGGKANRPWSYNFKPHHCRKRAPKFHQRSRHAYKTIDVVHDEKVGFFVGLNELHAYRVKYRNDDDTSRYVERFDDAENLAPGYEWPLDPSVLKTGTSGNTVVATSKVFESAHHISGIQFATQQSPAVQMIYDDDFRDPALTSYDWKNTDLWHGVGEARHRYELNRNLVTVTRHSGDVQPEPTTIKPYRIVRPLPTPVFSVRQEERRPSAVGGTSSGPYPQPAKGYLHAAVRFSTQADLTAPLYLQIVRDSDDFILAEKELDPPIGETVEEYISYQAGSLAPTADLVRARFVQYGGSNDGWSLDALSLFHDGIAWEFSVNGGADWVLASPGVRNNPHGVLSFPISGSQLRWRATGMLPNLTVTSLQIRPLYEGLLSSRPQGLLRGPNISEYDHEPYINDDPEFRAWSHPIPYPWFSASRRFARLPIEGAPVVTPFSRYYGRLGAEPALGISDQTTRLHTHVRTPQDSAAYSDSLGRAVMAFRVALDTLPIADSTRATPLPPTDEIVDVPHHDVARGET